MSTAPKTTSPKALRTAMAKGAFAPAYLLTGEDFLKEELLRDLVKAAVDPATRDFNYEVRRGGELTAETLGSLLATPPMMAERRVVVVRDPGALRKDARAALLRALAAPAPDTLLVLVAPAGAKADKDLEEAATVCHLRALTGDELPKWIGHHAGQLGATITPDAAALLQSAVGDDLPALAGELDKLVSYANGRTITEAMVSDAVGVRREETLGHFLDLVLAREATQALVALPEVLAQPKSGGVPIVIALTVQTMALAWMRAARDENLVPQHRLEGELYNFLKEAASFVGRPWGEAVKAWVHALPRWDAASLARALDALLATDIALKESRVSDEEQLLASLVLTLCADRAGAARAA